MEIPAYAKLNLSLEVTGRREDGYHSIASVMQLISLHDTLTFAPAPGLQLTCGDPGLAGKDNLVYRAARLLQRTAGVETGAHITLEKRIPLSAGLGGGSSDAAATLIGLDRLWRLNLPCAEMQRLAGALGSDVPFFLDGPTALVEGRGEKVTPLPPPLPFWAVLLYQPSAIPEKTKRLYASLTPQDLSSGEATRSLTARLPGDITLLPLHNAFERPAFRIFSSLAGARQKMLKAGAGTVHLSGSGPTLYTLFPEAAHAEAHSLHRRLLQAGLISYLTRSLTPGEQ